MGETDVMSQINCSSIVVAKAGKAISILRLNTRLLFGLKNYIWAYLW